MILEEQTYRIQVGKVDQLVEAYENRGMGILKSHLGDFVGCWTSDVGGDMDEMIQIWRFPNVEDRAIRRAALASDPAWRTFAAEFGHLILQRRMRLLKGVSFSPIG